MEIEEIELDLIDEPADDIREEIDRGGLEELATSIKNTGLIQPIVVFRKMDRYEVAVGHRRLLASRIAGIEKITVLVKEIKPDEIETMKLDENIFREDLSAIQIAKYINKVMRTKGLSVMEISRYLRKTPQWTNSMLRLLDTNEYTQKAVDRGEISYSAALELQKVEDEKHRDVLTRAAATGGAHTRIVKGWVQNYRQEVETRDKVNGMDQIMVKEDPIKEIKTRCKLCGKEYLQEELIIIQIDPRCYPIFEEMAANVRRELEEVEKEQ